MVTDVVSCGVIAELALVEVLLVVEKLFNEGQATCDETGKSSRRNCDAKSDSHSCELDASCLSNGSGRSV